MASSGTGATSGLLAFMPLTLASDAPKQDQLLILGAESVAPIHMLPEVM